MTENAPDTGANESDPAEAIVQVDIDAAPADVWRALTTDEGLASWIGEGSTIGDQVGDEIRVHDVVTGRHKRGVLDEVSTGRRLGYTWWPETEPANATRVAISLEPTPTGTLVTVIETRPLAPADHGAAPVQASMAASFRGDWTWRAAVLTIAATSLTLAAPGVAYC